jgi:hypothetical protein
VYWRHDHWVLQWWEPAQRKNVAERVDGDLVAAIARAREIDRRLIDFKRSGRACGRVNHDEMVKKFLADMEARCDAGQIEPRSVSRFRSALVGHYLPFIQQPQIARSFPFPKNVDRQFRLALAAFLSTRDVSANGSIHGAKRRMKGNRFVLASVRAAYQWAADPDRGGLLPDGFRNPFLGSGGDRKIISDPFGDPDITVQMAGEMLRACDSYQLRLFTPLLFYGLRAAEPVYLFHEYVREPWLLVPCSSIIAYTTKGKRDKRLPLIEPIQWLLNADGKSLGLLYHRRFVGAGTAKPPLLGLSLEQLSSKFQERLRSQGVASAASRQRLRDQLLHDAGGIDYDRSEGEFRRLAQALGWPRKTTLKDLRHLFLTTLSNSGLAEPYRQFLAGHAPSQAPVMHYTHLNQMREQYLKAINQEWPVLLDILQSRVADLQTAHGSPRANTSAGSSEDGLLNYGLNTRR